MRRYTEWLSVGAVAMAAVVACGDDPPGRSPMTGAGAGGLADGAGQAGDEPGSAGTNGVPVGGMPGSSGSSGLAGAGPAAAGAGGEGGAAQPVSNDVHGQVRSAYLPWPNAVVRVNGVSTTTDAAGSFTVEDVAEEYQLVVYLPDYNYVRVYDGLHTRQPLANLGPNIFEGVEKSATVRGKVIGGAEAPLPQYLYTEARYVSNTRGHLRTSFFDPPEAFDLDPIWSDPGDTDEGEIWVFQTIELPQVGLTEYTGFGRRAVSITAGDILGSVNGSALTDVTLIDPDEYTVSGQLTAPQGFTIYQDKLFVGPWWTFAQLDLGVNSLVFPDIDVPKLVNVEMQGTGAQFANVTWLAPDAADAAWDLEVPPPATLLTPPVAANAVTLQTSFSWSGLPASSVALLWVHIGDWTIERVTTAGSTTLFDLSVFGVSVPVDTEGNWNVQAIGPAASMEEAMAALDSHYTYGPLPRFLIDSDMRAFATAP